MHKIYLCNVPVLKRPADSDEPLYCEGQGDVDGGTEGHGRHGVEELDI